MKKTLLFTCGVAIALSAGAQNNSAKYICKMPPRYITENSKHVSHVTNVVAPISERKTPLVITNTAVTNVQLGCANNILGGYTRPGRATLDYCPALNTLTMIHRSGPSAPCNDGTASSGYYMFDVSKNGGTTWTTNQGPIADGGANPGRYPAGAIYNPTGNTNPDSAFIAYHGSALDGGGSMWAGYQTGAAVIGNPMNPSQQVDLFGNTVNFYGLIPECYSIDNMGRAWVSDISDTSNLSGSTLEDTILLRKGTWNTTTRRYDFATTKIYFSLVAGEWAESNVAFYGNTGYLSVIANADLTFASDSSMYVTIWKSTDGGTTWGNPHQISMDVNTQMGTTGVKYGAGFQIDGAVDKNGMLHLILPIAPAVGASITTVPGSWGQFAIQTDGTTDTKLLLQKPESFRGYMGTGAVSGVLTEDTRGQIAESTAGDKIFYTWFTTDTVTWQPDTSAVVAGNYNMHPDAWVRMYDVNMGSLDPAKNITAGTNADGGMTFGYVANWAAQGTCGAGSYQVQLGYQTLSTAGNPEAPVYFYYVGGACITSVNDLANNVFSIGDAYPNPATGLTTVDLNLKQNSNLSLDVTNVIGQTVYSTSLNNLSTGEHKLTVDASKWNSGVYFYTVKSKDFEVTKKIIRQ